MRGHSFVSLGRSPNPPPSHQRAHSITRPPRDATARPRCGFVHTQHSDLTPRDHPGPHGHVRDTCGQTSSRPVGSVKVGMRHKRLCIFDRVPPMRRLRHQWLPSDESGRETDNWPTCTGWEGTTRQGTRRQPRGGSRRPPAPLREVCRWSSSVAARCSLRVARSHSRLVASKGCLPVGQARVDRRAFPGLLVGGIHLASPPAPLVLWLPAPPRACLLLPTSCAPDRPRVTRQRRARPGIPPRRGRAWRGHVVVKPGAAAVCGTARGGCNAAYSRVPRDSAAHAVRGPAVRLLWCRCRAAAAAAPAAAAQPRGTS
eukprot:COSAG02_NODE_235_length_27784_cov_9.895828_6_plen_314_part_00